MSQIIQDSEFAALPRELREALHDLMERKGLDLPVLPEVASQVITASMDEECDLRKLSTLISRDQSMTGHLLRLSNCALYAPPTPIVSLQQALNRLGLKKIRELAVIISCESKVFRVAGFDLAVRALFRLSLAAAAFAQEIARARRWNLEEAFLCGLLHDVGRPVLLQTIVDLKERMELAIERAVIERASLEHHCRVGSELVQSWDLPESLGEAILYHHEPELAEQSRDLAMLTCLADDLARLALGVQGVSEDDIRSHPMIGHLAVGEEEVSRLLSQREAIMGIVESIA